MSNKSKDLLNLIKPILDYRKYRFVHLPNGLRAVLISDLKENEKPMNLFQRSLAELKENKLKEELDEKQIAAATLCIGVGSFSDPFESQGLAHYLEHMVFMGSKKYPNENDFSSYLSQRGGSSNAFTSAKKTVFYFTIRPNHFYESLDRFANFFIHPLLLEDSMDRELTAVNSEYEMAKISDAFRDSALRNTLTKEGTPYQLFACGSKKSLKEIPSEKGIDVYKFLQELRKKMYSASFMTLSIVAKDSLDNLEKMIRHIFEDIPSNSESDAPDFRAHAMPFDKEKFNKLYKINPIKDVNILEITWSLPSHYPEYKSHPLQIFDYLIGHEAKGSILSLLRKKNLAVELSAGCSLQSCPSYNEMNEIFSIRIVLTEKGLENYEEVVEIVFQYLNVLREKGISTELFEEYKVLKKLNFQYSALPSPVDSAMNVSQALQYVDDLDWLLCPYTFQDTFNVNEFNTILSFFRPENACFFLKSKNFAEECNLEEPWYGCKYSVHDLNPDKLCEWSSAKPTEDLFLPEKNIFIPSNFDVLPVDEQPVDLPVDLTKTLKNYSKYGCLYYKMDKHFRIPKAYVKFMLWSKHAFENDKNIVLHSLFTYAISQNLLDISYYANEATFTYQISGTRSLSIDCHGFNDTLFNLFRTIIEYCKNFSITDSQFQAYVDIYRQDYFTKWYKPQQLVMGLDSYAHLTMATMPMDLLKVLQSLTPDDLRHYHKEFFRELRLSAYIHGNVTADEAKKYFKFAVDSLKFHQLSEIPFAQVRMKPIGDHRLRVYNLNPNDVNTAILNVYQYGPVNIHQSCVLRLLSAILYEPAFDFLRTKETLGYGVWCSSQITLGIASLRITVLSQSTKHSLDHCHDKMDEFIYNIAAEKLKNLQDDDFEDFIQSEIAKRQAEDSKMSQEVERFSAELITDEYVFDRREREIDALKSMKKTDVINMFEEFISNENNRRRISFQVEAKKDNASKEEIKQKSDKWNLVLETFKPVNGNAGQWLNDPKEAHKWELYPQHKIVN